MNNDWDDHFDSEELAAQRPFDEVLAEIMSAEPLPIHLLYRLSDMVTSERDAFQTQWPQVAVERRQEIVRHLADISEENYVVDFAPVFAYCLQDEAPAVRAAALDGLWDATDLALIDPIIARLESDPAHEVRAAAAGALAHYVLMSEWGEISRDVSPRLTEVLLSAYHADDAPLAVQQSALEALGAVTDRRVQALISQAYESSAPGLQRSALFAMGNSADKRWLTVVLDEMQNPEPEMRAEAARAAGGIGKSDAVSHLANLTLDEDVDVALAAVVALGQIGGETAEEILIGLGDDPELAHLHTAVEEALEDISWLSGDFDLLSLNEDDLGVDNDFGFLN